MPFRSYFYLDKKQFPEGHVDQLINRRLACWHTNSHREFLRRIERDVPDAIVLFGERSSELLEVILKAQMLRNDTLIYLVGEDSTKNRESGVFRIFSPAQINLRAVTTELIYDLEVLHSAISHKDGIQRGLTNPCVPVGILCASTGGPRYVAKILAELRLEQEALIILQHMGETFVADFVRHLELESKKQIQVVEAEATIQPGRIYIPAGGYHLLIFRDGTTIKLRAIKIRALELYTPCIDLTLFSAAAHLHDECSVLILSGMGKDGAAGARALKDRGSRIFCQNPILSPVPSMPESAATISRAEIVKLDSLLAEKFFGGLHRAKSAV